jgi:hypothetical protein
MRLDERVSFDTIVPRIFARPTPVILPGTNYQRGRCANMARAFVGRNGFVRQSYRSVERHSRLVFAQPPR